MIDTPISWTGAAMALLAALAVPSHAARWPGSAVHVTTEASVAAVPTLRSAADAIPSTTSGSGAVEKSRPEAAADELRIKRQTVCVAARHWAAGELSDTILYRARREGNRLTVGYFAHWSTERPWGNNVLSYTVVPALATDAFYSHFMFLWPGMKDVLYGPDDVEGARVEYEVRPDGSLDVVRGSAEDGVHGSVQLSRNDLLDSKGRVVFLTQVWSHQLGSHGGGKLADEGGAESLHCYAAPAVRRMPDDVARSFRLGDEQQPRRAKPAWAAVGSSGTL
jgi:hypothetical protein